MGIKEFELMPGLECGGVATFLRDALTSRATLFIYCQRSAQTPRALRMGRHWPVKPTTQELARRYISWRWSRQVSGIGCVESETEGTRPAFPCVISCSLWQKNRPR